MDEQQTDQLAPAGWYAQPGSEAQPEVPALPPADYPFGQPPVATPPAGLRSGTVSVWLLAFMPWLTLASVIVAFGFAIYAENPTWYWVATLLLPCLLTVGLALLDGRRLREWRHPRVPSWAWSLLGAPAYLIARAIVTRGQTRFGAAPMWVALANIVASMLGAALAVVALASAVLYLISELSNAMSGIA